MNVQFEGKPLFQVLSPKSKDHPEFWVPDFVAGRMLADLEASELGGKVLDAMGIRDNTPQESENIGRIHDGWCDPSS